MQFNLFYDLSKLDFGAFLPFFVELECEAFSCKDKE